MTPTTRLTAEERRDAVVAAAMTEFAQTGYAGTSTEAIARRSGVSQPYLFQLFGTKKDLFLAAVRHGFGRTRTVFEVVGRQARAEDLPNGGGVVRCGRPRARGVVRDGHAHEHGRRDRTGHGRGGGLQLRVSREDRRCPMMTSIETPFFAVELSDY
jgi:AcrR family transcriptional regulator